MRGRFKHRGSVIPPSYIFKRRHTLKIFAPAIKAVAVLMIYVLVAACSHQEPMEIPLLVTDRSPGVIICRLSIPLRYMEMPTMPLDKWPVCVIDQDLAPLRQQDVH